MLYGFSSACKSLVLEMYLRSCSHLTWGHNGGRFQCKRCASQKAEGKCDLHRAEVGRSEAAGVSLELSTSVALAPDLFGFTITLAHDPHGCDL